MNESVFAHVHPQVARALMRVSDEEIQTRVGPKAFRKAQQAQRDVYEVTWQSPQHLSARVRMGGIAPRVHLHFLDTHVTTQCACLLAGECEHTAAVLLYARSEMSHETYEALTWEEQLNALLGQYDDVGENLALYLEYSASAADIWLTPMRPGVQRPWVTKRAGWTDFAAIEWGSITEGLNIEHVRLMREMYRFSRQNRRWTNPGELTLSSLSTDAFRLLKRAQDIGMTLLVDLHSWQSLRLGTSDVRVFVEEQVHKDGITLHPMVMPSPEYSGHIPPAEVQVADVEVCEGGHYLRHISDNAVEDPFISMGDIHIPAVDIAHYMNDYAGRLYARYPRMTHAHNGHETTSEDHTPSAQCEKVALVGKLQSRNEGKNVRLTWWVRYEHHGQNSYARISKRHYICMERGDHQPWHQVWHKVSDYLKRTDIPLKTLPEHMEVSQQWDFPSYLMPLFRRHIIEALHIEGLEWDLEQVHDNVIVDTPMRIHTTIRPSTQHLDWFDLSATICVGNTQIPLTEALRVVASGEEHVFIQGKWIRIDPQRLSALRVALEQAALLSPEQRNPHMTPWHAHLWHQISELSDETDAHHEWMSHIKTLPRNGVLKPVALVESHSVRLRPYQLQGHVWLTSLMRAALGGVLADDMGLGKTLQMLAAIASMKNYHARQGQHMGPVVVVAPTSVVSTWVEESKRWYPHMRVRAVKTSSKVRSDSIEDLAQGVDIVVVTYTVVRLDASEFASVKWQGCVLDEAHIAKNPRTAIHKALKNMPREWTIALTGTPVENSLTDLWALLNLTSPGLLPAWPRFRERFVTPIEKQGENHKLIQLQGAIAPFMLRRTKEAVATDLPEKIDMTLSIPLSPNARHYYERILTAQRARILGLLASTGRHHIEVLSAMTRLRQAAIDPGLIDPHFANIHSAKTDTLIEILKQIIPAGHQALIFSQFTSYLDRIENALNHAGITYTRLDGNTRNRQDVIKQFQNGHASTFLISLKAGGTGLTLTEADYVFVMDPWWNPTTEAQAIDRAHRIGQTQPVTVYRLISENTIEEKVLQLQNKKRALVNTLITQDNTSSGHINLDDIRALIAP